MSPLATPSAVKKKIIFFDGDGTLWYPKLTKRTQKPHWIYSDISTKDEYLLHLELTPGTKGALQTFKDAGMQLVVISANSYAEEIAVKEIKERIDYFGLTSLFNTYRSSAGDDPNDKARVILEVLNDLHLTKGDAVMVGDSFFYDYLAAKEIGVDAYFIENDIAKMPEVIPDDLVKIQEVHDLVDILDL